MITEHYPNFDHAIERKRHWASRYRIGTTADGLILPDQDKSRLDAKIVPSLDQAHEQLQAALGQGKYGVYLPGSYDLTHVGHLSFICQSVDYCLERINRINPGVVRNDLYLLALVDSDKLVHHNKLFKHVSEGGTEPFFRPIEGGVDETGRYPRLDAVATLPVDAVGFLPAPTDPNLPSPLSLDPELAIATISAGLANPRAHEALTKAVQSYPKLTNHFANNSLDFSDWWSIELWQLYLTLALTKTQHPSNTPLPHQFKRGGITRLISADDFKYYDEVRLISNIAGVAVEKLQDIHAHSSTRLLQEHLPEDLLRRKKIALSPGQ